MQEEGKTKVTPGVSKAEAYLKDEEAARRQEALAKAEKYTIRGVHDIIKRDVPPPVEIWGGISKGNMLAEVIGASGIGKSRIMLNLAVRQALAGLVWPEGEVTEVEITADGTKEPEGPEFAGLPLYRGEIKWLLMGTENSLYRLKNDLAAMTKECSEEQLEHLNKFVRLSTLEEDGDGNMTMGDPANVAKLAATLAVEKPDVVVFDPWGDVCAGSELDDQMVRESIRTLRSCKPPDHDMAIIIVNHARMGEKENANAIGLEEGNFGKNSKVLYTVARCVWNLSAGINPAKASVIVFHHAKCSDRERYEDHAVFLNAETMSYVTSEFNAKMSADYMAANASTPTQNKAAVREANKTMQIEDGVKALANEIVVKRRHIIKRSEAESLLSKVNVPTRVMESVYLAMKEKYGVELRRIPGKGTTQYLGIAEGFSKMEKGE